MEEITTRNIGVVLVSWQIPEQRLQAHFRWNALLYGETGATVFVVTDREYDLPDCARCVVYPVDQLPRHRGERMFSLTRTKNYGIKAAIQAGCDPIICTDVDVCFERPAWEAALNVKPGEAAVPIHWMSYADEKARRRDRYKVEPWCSGTVTMTALDWKKCPFHERQWGYGLDDWLLLQRMTVAGLDIDREHYVFHMAHIDGAEQGLRAGRSDQWNRDNGINPRNHGHNQRFMMPNGVNQGLLEPNGVDQLVPEDARVCVVGQGPSAQGQGELIDGCDFVVRIKAFWQYGAQDAGSKVDAWAWFGNTKPGELDYVPDGGIREHVPDHAQHWFTDCAQEVSKYRNQARLIQAERLSKTPVLQISDQMRNHAARYIGSHPTTGFLAVCMAMDRLSAGELVLVGFDSTGIDRPNFGDAHGGCVTGDDRIDLLAEKRAIAEIATGRWLGEPTQTHLTWPDMPEGVI